MDCWRHAWVSDHGKVETFTIAGTEVEVAIDRVTGLGDFVELEIRAEQGEVPLAQACLQSLAQELGCSSPERRSYLELLLATAREG